MTYHTDRVLVAHASSGGSTKSVAEFVAASLRARGLVADVRGVDECPDLSGYDVVVLGSAVHNRALLPAAEDFVRHNAATLRRMPVWLFSLGIGPALRGPVGHVLRDAVPPRIGSLCELIGPRDYRAFPGVVPRAAFSPMSRVVLWACGGRCGDLRDWAAMAAWATGIAGYLHEPLPAEASPHGDVTTGPARGIPPVVRNGETAAAVQR
jgi:menaquinone-dependent protoporphyrinogen oxidase